MPGMIVRPPASRRRVDEPASAAIAGVSPTAMTRSPLIAIAWAHGCAGFAVKTFPLTRTASGAETPAHATIEIEKRPATHAMRGIMFVLVTESGTLSRQIIAAFATLQKLQKNRWSSFEK